MKIISWNCNGAFRKKFQYIEHFDADIYVITECEDPKISKDLKYQEFAQNHIWYGLNKHKGVGVFCKPEIELSIPSWFNPDRKYIIPIHVNHQFYLYACWLCYLKPPQRPYIGQLWEYIQENKQHLNNCILLGDFNSNKIWDKHTRCWNHSHVVAELETLKIESLYHRSFQDQQGTEQYPTFYLRRKLSSPYHIDYAFASTSLLSASSTLKVGAFDDWIPYSDHMPLLINL